MADYTTSEILNEIAKVFPANIETTREGGTNNTADEYAQLVELASFTLLINNDAIFYLGQLARNRLIGLVKKEIAFIEDMLVAVDDLSQVGQPVTDTTTLSNADTALLALDASTSVVGRPETTRFSFLMDQFAENYRQNVQSRLNQNLVRPQESAKTILRTNFIGLDSLHSRVVLSIDSLKSLLGAFEELDIPSKVAATSISRVRTLLNDIEEDIDLQTDAENIAASRKNLLTTLTSKVAVNLIGTFADPRALKFRSPINPIPVTVAHLGRVTGSGEAASVLTGAGPWTLPISADLSLAANGGATQVLSLNSILGAVLNGRNDETFFIIAEDKLHVIVDPDVHEAEAISASTTSNMTLTNFIQLGFKHLGMPVTFLDFAVPPALASDIYPRAITEMRTLQTGSISAFIPGTNLLSFASAVAGDESGVGIDSTHIGAYILDSVGARYEVLRIISTSVSLSVVEVSVPAGVASPTIGAASLHGQTVAATGGTKFDFSPATSLAPTGRLTMGPAVKTARFTTGIRTLAQIIVDIEADQGDYDAFPLGGALGQALNQHVAVQAVSNEPGRMTIVIRSKLSPYVQISRNFPRPKAAAAVMALEEDSAHGILGFREGELDTTDILTPSELIARLNALTDIEGSLEVTELGTGAALTTVHTTSTVVESTVDFDTLVSPGDQIEIQDGDARGIYQITVVGGSSLTLDRPPFDAIERNLSFRLFREQVRISSTRLTRDSSLEVVSAPAELGLTVGTVYGSIPQFEAIDKLGNLLSFTDVIPGDLLRIVGSAALTEITVVQDTQLSLVSGLPSNTEGAGFEIISDAAKQYDLLEQDLETYTTSPNLLLKNNFDENLDDIDNAITAAVIPGLNFASSRNQAARLLADLLSVLTDTPLRSDEYSTSIPTAPDNLLRILTDYDVAALDVVDDILDMFVSRKYDRAVNFLQTARLSDFYETNDETGSFSGAVLSSSRRVSNDLPVGATSAFKVDQEQNLAFSSGASPDPETDFDDFDDQPDEIGV